MEEKLPGSEGAWPLSLESLVPTGTGKPENWPCRAGCMGSLDWWRKEAHTSKECVVMIPATGGELESLANHSEELHGQRSSSEETPPTLRSPTDRATQGETKNFPQSMQKNFFLFSLALPSLRNGAPRVGQGVYGKTDPKTNPHPCFESAELRFCPMLEG